MTADNVVPGPGFSNILIEDRVFNYVRDLTMFTFKDVRTSFPNEADKTLYRAIKKLEDAHRIQFMGWHQRQKLYSCTSISQLPTVLDRKGDHAPSSMILKNIDHLYTNGHMSRLEEELNDFWITVAYFYVIARMPDGVEMRRAFFTNHRKLMDMRASLMNLVGSIDAMVKHPALNGDMEYFKGVFAGDDSEMPTIQEITDFKLWLSRFRKGQQGDV